MGFVPIRTDRLLLRPVRADDVEPLLARRNDLEVAALQDWATPYPRERAERVISDVMEMDGPTVDDWWMLTVADADDTTVHGDLVVHLTWEGRTAEIGYTLARESWGHGYAIESCTALVEYLFNGFGVHRIEAKLHPDNTASAMLLERLGMLFEGHTRGSYWLGDDNSDDWLYAMLRPDWQAWRNRRRDQPAQVRLVEVTADNLSAVLRMQTHKSQERFVAPNWRSLAEALVPEPYEGQPVVPWYRAVEADGELVGFVMLSLPTPVQPETYLWRLLVDRMHQRRGIGTAIVELVAGESRAIGATDMLTSWVPGRGSPEPMYLGYGFVPTGEVDDGEIVARLRL